MKTEAYDSMTVTESAPLLPPPDALLDRIAAMESRFGSLLTTSHDVEDRLNGLEATMREAEARLEKMADHMIDRRPASAPLGHAVANTRPYR